MNQIKEQSQRVEYLTGHFGHNISEENLDRLLPLDLRRALLTTDLVQSVEYFFGVPGSLTVFPLVPYYECTVGDACLAEGTLKGRVARFGHAAVFGWSVCVLLKVDEDASNCHTQVIVNM